MGTEDLVLDASLIASYILNEKPEVKEMMEECIKDGGRLLVPELAYVEVANAVWKAHALRRLMSREDSTETLQRLYELPISGCRHDWKVAVRAFKVALQSGTPVYDAIYIALAEIEGCELVTSDSKQSRAAEGIVKIRLV